MANTKLVKERQARSSA